MLLITATRWRMRWGGRYVENALNLRLSLGASAAEHEGNVDVGGDGEEPTAEEIM